MKAWIQRVTEASVEIAGEMVSQIGQGYLVLLGVTHSDTEKTADEIADRICKLRICEDENGKTNRSIIDVGGSVIVVSQFTLYADTSHGRRPGFSHAARPEIAEPLYERVVSNQTGNSIVLSFIYSNVKLASCFASASLLAHEYQ